MNTKFRYNIYSEYLKNKYNTKVYKIPVNIIATCPNRDGTVGIGGCIFCGEQGADFEMQSNEMSISKQIEKNMEYIKKKYKAEKFIIYFQNFSNTYIKFEKFKEYILEACKANVVGINISTRPDCIDDKYLKFLKRIKKEKEIDICFELGLQTVNYHTLYKINRGHTLAEFIDAVIRIKKYKFDICTHVILDLPWDNIYDIIESAKVLSALKVEQVKIHSLYIVKDTLLAKMYKSDEVQLVSKEEYIQRVVTFLEYLAPNIIIQRLIGRAPQEDTVIVNWNTSWWKIKDEIYEYFEEKDTFQGKKFNYLDGKILKNLV